MKYLSFAAFVVLALGCKGVPVAQLDPSEVERIEIFPSRWDGPGQPPESTVLTEPEPIRTVLAAIQSVGEADRSTITDQARIMVVEKSGKKNLLQLQPGADPRYYEYLAQGAAVRIPRGEFLAAMEKVGVTWMPR
jgi:hypothetical protein